MFLTIFMIIIILNLKVIDGELIEWRWKSKIFLQQGERFERLCETKRKLTDDEHLSWLVFYHDGRMEKINQSKLIIDSFTTHHEGIAICQVTTTNGFTLDEQFVFLTNDPTDLINERFEGSEQALIDDEMNNVHHYCGADLHIEYRQEDVADFHLDFIQHYERVRLHSNHLHLKKVKHEHEGYYECIVRLSNGLVGVRALFLSVGGGPRQISLRETQFYAEIHQHVTLLCPIFSALPAWYTFVPPSSAIEGLSSLTGFDYLRIKNVSSSHSGGFTCRVTTSDGDDGYSLTSKFHLDVYGPPEYVKPYLYENVYLSFHRNIEHLLHCAIAGNPSVTYQWFIGDVHRKKSSDAPVSNQTMTCLAKNNRGSKRQVFHLQWKD